MFPHLAFLRIQDGGLGQFSTFDDIERCVIPLSTGFPGCGVPFWNVLFGYGVKVKVKSEVKDQI